MWRLPRCSDRELVGGGVRAPEGGEGGMLGGGLRRGGTLAPAIGGNPDPRPTPMQPPGTSKVLWSYLQLVLGSIRSVPRFYNRSFEL